MRQQVARSLLPVVIYLFYILFIDQTLAIRHPRPLPGVPFDDSEDPEYYNGRGYHPILSAHQDDGPQDDLNARLRNPPSELNVVAGPSISSSPSQLSDKAQESSSTNLTNVEASTRMQNDTKSSTGDQNLAENSMEKQTATLAQDSDEDESNVERDTDSDALTRLPDISTSDTSATPSIVSRESEARSELPQGKEVLNQEQDLSKDPEIPDNAGISDMSTNGTYNVPNASLPNEGAEPALRTPDGQEEESASIQKQGAPDDHEKEERIESNQKQGASDDQQEEGGIASNQKQGAPDDQHEEEETASNQEQAATDDQQERKQASDQKQESPIDVVQPSNPDNEIVDTTNPSNELPPMDEAAPTLVVTDGQKDERTVLNQKQEAMLDASQSENSGILTFDTLHPPDAPPTKDKATPTLKIPNEQSGDVPQDPVETEDEILIDSAVQNSTHDSENLDHPPAEGFISIRNMLNIFLCAIVVLIVTIYYLLPGQVIDTQLLDTSVYSRKLTKRQLVELEMQNKSLKIHLKLAPILKQEAIINDTLKAKSHLLSRLKACHNLMSKNESSRNAIKLALYSQLALLRNLINLNSIPDITRDIEWSKIYTKLEERTFEMQVEIEFLEEQMNLFRMFSKRFHEQYQSLTKAIEEEQKRGDMIQDDRARLYSSQGII